jgi:predicted nucleic acid-binding protein
MDGTILLDSNILIDYLRNHKEAIDYLENLSSVPKVSAVTIAELYAGVREGLERQILDELVNDLVVIAITHDIAVKGGLFRRDYLRSHGMELADAIIAATAANENATLVTLNKKHFPMFPDLVVPYRKT